MANLKASDNPFPSILMVEGDPEDLEANPASGERRLAVGTDHLLYLVDDAGVATEVGGSSGMSDPMTTRGDLIIRNASNVTARLGRGSSSQVLTSDGTDIAWATPATAGLLAVRQYAPGSDATYTTTSATYADVDATNMFVTFTAPASGNVLVRVTCWVDIGTSVFGLLGLREATTNIGTPMMVIRGSGGQALAAAPFYLTGLSGGSHTYKLSFAVITPGTAFRVLVGDGTSFGPGVFEVWSAP